jgi:Domain of unknown function (DUF4251)
MKKLCIFVITLLILSSCTTSKEANSSRAESRKEKKLTDQTLVKNAIESRRYIIKFYRIYLAYGGFRELIPRANYIIVDGNRAILNTAYVGRQYDIRPIAAIDIRGRAEQYALTNNANKGSYEIKLKLDNGGPNSFNVYINISKNGYSTISVSSLKIDNINYAGHLVPIPGTTTKSEKQENTI